MFCANLLFSLARPQASYVYDPNDFAAEVIEYVQGTGDKDFLSGQLYNNPNMALGRPTLITTGDDWYIPANENVPVVPVYPPFRSFELVAIGNGGHLTVKFNLRVVHDINNPYGIDFIIYGNAFLTISGGQNWTNGNPELTTVVGSCFSQAGYSRCQPGWQ